jgi:hypothetical protein
MFTAAARGTSGVRVSTWESWVSPQPERIVFVIVIILSSPRYTSVPRSADFYADHDFDEFLLVLSFQSLFLFTSVP